MATVTCTSFRTVKVAAVEIFATEWSLDGASLCERAAARLTAFLSTRLDTSVPACRPSARPPAPHAPRPASCCCSRYCCWTPGSGRCRWCPRASPASTALRRAGLPLPVSSNTTPTTFWFLPQYLPTTRCFGRHSNCSSSSSSCLSHRFPSPLV